MATKVNFEMRPGRPNFAWQLERMQNIAERYGWTKFVSLQPQYNLIYREEECDRRSVADGLEQD